MARRGPAKKRQINEDPIFGSRVVAKFINQAMKSGKKTAAAREVYEAFAILDKKGQDPLAVFSQALENVKPLMEVRPRRIGGAAYQVPAPVRGPRKESLAIRWLLGAARERPNKEYHTFAEKLVAEITDAVAGTGAAMKKKENMQRMAEAYNAIDKIRW